VAVAAVVVVAVVAAAPGAKKMINGRAEHGGRQRGPLASAERE
jgi:hypothetical protein